MFRRSVVFLGPSLPPEQLIKSFPNVKFIFLPSVKDVPTDNDREDGLFIVPPIMSGDLFYLSSKTPSIIVGIIDGFFENAPSVWHKEILYSLSKDIPVYGAASMGALRASELSDFGMKGVGQIYHCFKESIYEDDDEVAVIHGPKELGYASISDAMVNIRPTLELALSQKVICNKAHDDLLHLAKSLFYKDRKWDYILSEYQTKNPTILDHDSFRDWVGTNQINQKRFDAIELVRTLIHHDKNGSVNYSYSFHDTSIWRKFIYA